MTIANFCEAVLFPQTNWIQSDATKRDYARAIRRLHSYLGRPPSLADLTTETLAGLHGHLRARHWTERTCLDVTRRLLAIRIAFEKKGGAQ